MKKNIFLLIAMSTLLSVHAQDTDYTNMIVNSSFELQTEGVSNPAGTTWKPRLQTPVTGFYGWTVDFSKLGTTNSQGINQDASNKDQDNVCWINGNALLPELFEFYQIVDGLTAGTYKVQCRLAVDYTNKLTSQRLFANENVQYYGNSTNSELNLTPGEINTFADYTPADKVLRDMVVYTTLTAGQSLKIGIRTGGKLGNGSFADGSLVPIAGWFKVDYFRLAKIEPAVASDASIKELTLNTGTLTTTFNPAITTYTVNLPAETSTVTPTVITNVSGVVVTGAGAVDVSLGTGTSTVTTKALDGITTLTYTLNYKVIGKLAPVRTLILPGNPNILYMGRVDFTKPDRPLFAYPNVTIKAKFEGKSLDLLLKHYNGSAFTDNYFISIIDGGTPVKFRVYSTEQVYSIAKNLAEGVHKVEIVKVTESYNGECEFLGFKTDEGKGLVTPDPLPELKLEFYGNSITCGYGIEGGDRPASDNSYKAYTAVAARELNAQFHTTSYSGIGVVMGFPAFLMGEMYNKTIALSTYIPQPANNIWNFATYVPNVVIVALGTNDYNKGLYNGSLATATFTTGYKALMTKIRTAYPNAQIICTNSPMVADAKLANAIKSVVTDVNASGDNKVFYFSFTRMIGGGFGGHPGVSDGQTNGKELAAYIHTKLAVTSIDEVDKNNDAISIFPNPAKDNLSITNLAPGSLISVTGLDARFVSTQKIANSTVNFNVSNWSKGVYLFNIQEKNSSTVRKVLVH